MRILLIGGGGREHALAWAMSKSNLCTALYCAPGNPGMAEIGENIELDVRDHDAVIAFCRLRTIDLVVIGPELPLVDGLVDRLTAEEIAAFGPTAAAAQLEGSKAFTKALCCELGIPTADYVVCTDTVMAHAVVERKAPPLVIKADGLAAGKGVTIAGSAVEAHRAIDDYFSAGGDQLVIEDFLEGEEASFFVLCDGERVLPLASAQDHKRAFDGDTGPNTGGMGAYSPAPVMSAELVAQTLDQIIMPTITGMRMRGTPYRGVLYAGLMITPEGPKLIEYNVRFGDPECQVIMPRLRSDIVELMLACATGSLADKSAEWHDDSVITVVLASIGYPAAYNRGEELDLTAVRARDVMIFHAGTAQRNGALVTAGGRVLNVTARGSDLRVARDIAYDAIDHIHWPGGMYRSDIGWRALNKK